jgi:phosphoribosylaminoimidazole-succinocarboxamide synthase
VGKQYADQIEALSLQIYRSANDYAAKRGIIIADTKFEFGLDEKTTPPTVVLIDEVLTPDSSRFWRADKYEVGRGQDSYDKQYLRGRIPIESTQLQRVQLLLMLRIDWLTRNGLKGKEEVEMPSGVVSNTLDRYKEAYQTLSGKRWIAAA